MESISEITKLLHWFQQAGMHGMEKQEFHRDEFIEHHEQTRESWSRGLRMAREKGLPGFMHSAPNDSIAPSAPLSSLKEITLPELELGKRHKGKVLYGRLCVVPFKMNSVNTVLEDKQGRGIRVAIYNVAVSDAPKQEVERRFPYGQKIAIKEPLYKLCLDGNIAIRVDNPADIVIDIYNQDELSSSGSDVKNAQELEALRAQGNQLFSQQDYVAALDKYSTCINLALRHHAQDDQQGKSLTLRPANGHQQEKLADGSIYSILMLAYTNRAECWLRLQKYKEAVADADKALACNPKHVKSLFRKGKGLRGLGKYEESCKVLVEALKITPEDQNIRDELKAGTVCLHQSQKGIYDLGKFYTLGTPMPCVDYIGPVEIQRVFYGSGRRGLFATRDVQPGELLLVSNAVAMKSRSIVDQFSFKVDKFTFHSWSLSGTGSETGHGDIHRDLVTEAANAAVGSQRLLAQLYSLAADGDGSKSIPAMELFRSGSQWLPTGAEDYQLDIGRIEKICYANSLTVSSETLIGVTKDEEEQTITTEKDPHGRMLPSSDRTDSMVDTGLWLLPSFINHSCTPNSQTFNMEKVLFVRAFRPVAAGEEITIPYFNILNPLSVRDKWVNFTCLCERCKLERTFKKSLEGLEVRLHSLLLDARNEVETSDSQVRVAVSKLAEMAEEVNEVIRANEITDPKQQAWIRSSFHHVYLCKYKLATDVNEAIQKIAALKVVVDALEPISVGVSTLQFSSMLLKDVEQRYFKHSPAYRITEERVLGLYRAAYGKESDRALLQLLLKANWRMYI